MSTIAPPKKPQINTALPGPLGQKIVEADAQFVTPSYPRPSFKLVADRAEGVWVTDVDGNVFLDCNAGVAVCSTGHCHPEVVSAIQEQTAKLIHMCGTDYYYRQMPDLARKLDEIVPIKAPTRTHFANSGTEAIETALKLAMHATGREKFIAFFNSFHGRTLGSLSLTSSRVAQRPVTLTIPTARSTTASIPFPLTASSRKLTLRVTSRARANALTLTVMRKRTRATSPFGKRLKRKRKRAGTRS
jgi:4-aminobutyrate aminotransferase